eukprot:6173736-Pleurochrysis_carterae.AAC.2
MIEASSSGVERVLSRVPRLVANCVPRLRVVFSQVFWMLAHTQHSLLCEVWDKLRRDARTDAMCNADAEPIHWLNHTAQHLWNMCVLAGEPFVIFEPSLGRHPRYAGSMGECSEFALLSPAGRCSPSGSLLAMAQTHAFQLGLARTYPIALNLQSDPFAIPRYSTCSLHS